MDWPILYKQVLKVKDTRSPVGVAVMWTERSVVADLLKDTNYCAIGNLYSSAGISAMIRNIYANPQIRKIVLWGADLSRSGQALLSFMEHGVDDNYFIQGDEKGGQIEKEIGKEAIDLFRKSVEVVNLRGKPVSDLQKTIRQWNNGAIPPFSEPKLFPTSRPKPFTFPSEQIGFRIQGDTTAVTWLKILTNIMRYGRNKTTRYTQENELKELLNVMAVVYNENPDEPYVPHYFPFSKKDLETYYPQVLSAKHIPGIAYTYGQRLRNHDGVDQIGNIIDLIKNRPFSKKMVAFTAKVKEDWSVVNKGDTPCLTQVLVSIQDGRLFMTTHFRSQDMVHGWPRNVFSLRKLQKLISDAAGYPMGAFVMVTHSAHIYSDDYELVEKILKENYEKELGFTSRQMFHEDPRGNVTIEVGEVATHGVGRPTKYAVKPPKTVEYEIVVKLYAPGGGLLLKEWRGKTAMDLYIAMINIGDYLVDPSHLIYIGTELERAEFYIKTGKPLAYNQDPAANKEL
ncbi:thymidylate synthase [Patescibacteria group bacterium]|nr:thymidylate synthase [Patescibacteria group bacterium]